MVRPNTLVIKSTGSGNVSLNGVPKAPLFLGKQSLTCLLSELLPFAFLL